MPRLMLMRLALPLLPPLQPKSVPHPSSPKCCLLLLSLLLLFVVHCQHCHPLPSPIHCLIIVFAFVITAGIMAVVIVIVVILVRHPTSVVMLPPLCLCHWALAPLDGTNSNALIIASPPPSHPSPPVLLLVVVIFVCNSPAIAFATCDHRKCSDLPAVVLAVHAGGSPTISLAMLAHYQHGELLAFALAAHASNLPTVALSSAAICLPLPLPHTPATCLRLPLTHLHIASAANCPLSPSPRTLNIIGMHAETVLLTLCKGGGIVLANIV